MKKIIIALIILAAILAAGILDHKHIDRVFDEFDERLYAIDTALKAGNEDEAEALTNDLVDWWDKKRLYVEIFAYSPDTRSISVTLGEIKGSLIADDVENAQSKVTSTLELVKNVHNMLDFNLSDIL